MREAPRARHPLTAGVLLAPLRAVYHQEIVDAATPLAPRFTAGHFDGDRAVDLEAVCAELPLCRDQGAARVVLALSRHAGGALRRDRVAGDPALERDLVVLAAHCVARDLHEEARGRGWCGLPPASWWRVR